jgi:drug/metabolite transporter (DMT)-like permease
MSSSKVGTYTYVNPVVAIILGWWVLDETLTWRLVLGGVTILAGLLLVYFSRVRAAPLRPRNDLDVRAP